MLTQKATFKQRFQRGSINEISFLGPELGPLAGLMIGPEQGAWQPAEVTVASSRTKHTDRWGTLCSALAGVHLPSA